MKPIPFKVIHAEDVSLTVKQEEVDASRKLHFHPECQLSVVLKGEGVCMIGNWVDRCEAGHAFLIGANQPHLFKAGNSETSPLRLLSLFFREEIFGQRFFELPELSQVKELLLAARSGIRFDRKLSAKFSDWLMEMNQLTGAARLSGLLKVLHHAAIAPDRTLLSSPLPTIPRTSDIYSRLNRITKYVAENFHRPISLEEAAQVVNLSKYAFCRYFKMSTHRSFVHYLNEFRVRTACRLLSITAYSISQISLSTGFNNLSHFNRQFKKIMRCTPSEYRKLKKVF